MHDKFFPALCAGRVPPPSHFQMRSGATANRMPERKTDAHYPYVQAVKIDGTSNVRHF